MTDQDLRDLADDYGVPKKVLVEWCDSVGGDPEDFQDAFMGIGTTGRDWVEEYFYETGQIPDNIPDVLKYHIDWDGVWREFTMEGYFTIRHDGDAYIFGPY